MTDVSIPADLVYPAFAILLLPLASFLLCFIISERFSWLASIISTVLLFITVIAAYLVYHSVYAHSEVLMACQWITIGTKSISIGFLLTNHAVVMTFMVTIVSALVHLYSIGYMAGDSSSKKYFAFLGFFTFSMLGLILSSNLLLTFCFWELVGFSSYRLISHYRDQSKAASAATKAFLMTRVGDIGLLVGLLIIWSALGSLDIAELSHASFPLQTAAGLCIFLGVMGKSAQFPLFTWLPDAMKAPTPVSALIHAATMVAAGVYLLLRIYPLFTPDALTVITCVGAITALLGAIAALFQFDLKKILAYSTMSQLGLMITVIAASPEASFLHLLNHAFFKAGLFLGAGAIIHAMHMAHHTEKAVDVQDIRNMGALRTQMPVTFICFIICSAALSGLPFTSGFISKDIILSQLDAALISWWSPQGFVTILAWIAACLTPVYAFRVCWYVFFGKMKNDLVPLLEAPVIMRLPMIMLALSSLTIAVTVSPLSVGAWTSKLMYLQVFENDFYVPVIITLAVVLALLAAYFIYRTQPTRSTSRFLSQNFMLDAVYIRLIIEPVKRFAHITLSFDRNLIDKGIHGMVYAQVTLSHLAGWFDSAILDGSVNLIAGITGRVGMLTRSFSSGKIQSYILWSVLGLVIFMIWFLIF